MTQMKNLKLLSGGTTMVHVASSTYCKNSKSISSYANKSTGPGVLAGAQCQYTCVNDFYWFTVHSNLFYRLI